MGKQCQVTGKKPIFGNSRSKAMNATARVFQINLHKHRFWVPSEKRFVTLKLTAHAMKIIDKKGIEPVLASIRLRNKKVGQ